LFLWKYGLVVAEPDRGDAMVILTAAVLAAAVRMITEYLKR
jgi:hypothetical protein